MPNTFAVKAKRDNWSFRHFALLEKFLRTNICDQHFNEYHNQAIIINLQSFLITIVESTDVTFRLEFICDRYAIFSKAAEKKRTRNEAT